MTGSLLSVCLSVALSNESSLTPRTDGFIEIVCGTLLMILPQNTLAWISYDGLNVE